MSHAARAGTTAIDRRQQEHGHIAIEYLLLIALVGAATAAAARVIVPALEFVFAKYVEHVATYLTSVTVLYIDGFTH